jgi:hypothetical protein
MVAFTVSAEVTRAMDVSGPTRSKQTIAQGLVSLAGAAGLALLAPLAILAVGAPLALAVRGVLEAAEWLLRSIR